MTDKPIMIDGVDVTKCRFYKAGICNLSYAFVEEGYNCIICEDCPNCDYKQLQREKAVFRAYHDRDQNEITRLYGELQRKTAECERCKQALDEIAYLIRSVNGSLLEIVNNDIQSYLVKEGCDALDVIKQILNIISKAKGEEK